MVRGQENEETLGQEGLRMLLARSVVPSNVPSKRELIQQLGAGEARGAHNPEVARSKLAVANALNFYMFFCTSHSHYYKSK